MSGFRWWGYGLVVVIICVFAFVVWVPFYLGPDDLSNCTKTTDNMSLNTNCHQVDAIVAISGGDTSARTNEAIKLYKNGWAPKLIFSGAARDKTGPSNAAVMKDQALSSGVPPAAILIDETSINTKENAVYTKVLIQQNQLKRIILVTSAYHQRRAGLEFNKKTTAEGAPLYVVNHPVAHDDQWGEAWYLTTDGWWLATSELMKLIDIYNGGS